jgi:hypothetical protein
MGVLEDACQAEPVEVEVPVEVPVEVEVTRIVEVMITPEPTEPEAVVAVPFLEEWEGSGHNDVEAEAFVHWDEDDPAEVPTSCAKCHSTPGYRDFLGVDGTEAGVVDNAAEIGTTVQCAACHNEGTLVMDSVVMPSGVELTGLGDEARCMQCHQGRASNTSYREMLADLDLDTPDEELGFSNMHYFPAAATKYGGLAQGGYQYDGKTYDAYFFHVEEYESCIDCHDPHTLELKLEECQVCHMDVSSGEDFEAVRMYGSLVDYDGDGDEEEGVAEELVGLQDILYAAMQAYATDTAGAGIVYDSHSYPYYFIDTDGDGEASEEEAAYANQFKPWTPRLLKAAHNYQFSKKDPGAFAHGGKYIIQLLYDSAEDLGADLTGVHRDDAGHFAGSKEAFRHWDEDEAVSASCSKCHSADGLPFFLAEGENVSQEQANGFKCTTCHDSLPEFTRYEIESVEFPSGMEVASEFANTNLCINCHQGRESTPDVNSDIASAGVGDDEVSDDLGFLNIHYYPAGATRFGTEVKGGYEYDGKEYVGWYAHPISDCTDCHDAHALEVKVATCSACHSGVSSEEDLASIRMDATDYDGDGASEGILGEIETLKELLYAEIQAYATDTAGTAIVYDSHAYPYFFTDTNANGVPDEEEASYGNRYATWTARLVRATYNYQYSQKDPGAFAHNPKYMIQLLYDSLEDIGGDVSGLTRP